MSNTMAGKKSTKVVMTAVAALLAGLTLGAPATTATAAARPALPSFSMSEIDSGKATRQLSKTAYDNAMARVAKAKTGCTKDKVKIRKEW